MTHKEQVQMLQALELALELCPMVRNRLQANAESVGMSRNAFVIRSIEKAFGDRAFTPENFAAVKETLVEQLGFTPQI